MQRGCISRIRSHKSARSSRAQVYSQIRQDANAWNMPVVEGDADMVAEIRNGEKKSNIFGSPPKVNTFKSKEKRVQLQRSNKSGVSALPRQLMNMSMNVDE